jgi:hypothetical protein
MASLPFRIGQTDSGFVIRLHLACGYQTGSKVFDCEFRIFQVGISCQTGALVVFRRYFENERKQIIVHRSHGLTQIGFLFAAGSYLPRRSFQRRRVPATKTVFIIRVNLVVCGLNSSFHVLDL